MTKNFYKVLGLSRNASVEDIKKSYHNLALRYHPDKNKSPEAEQRFREILEAYKVLSDRKQRKDYDRQLPKKESQPKFRKSSSHSSTQYDSMEDLLFSNYFYNFLSFCGSVPRQASSRYEMYGRVKEPQAPPRNPPVLKELFVTLEELYRGVTRKVKFKRMAYGGARSEDKILEIVVKPGCKPGTKITFAREGDRSPGCIPADIVFIIREKPHEYFERCGNQDLKICIDLPLHEALCGNFKLEIPTVDGKTSPLCVRNEIIKPDSVKILKGKGMPIFKDPKKFGDLLVTFNIEFPETMSSSVRENIRKTLSG